MAALTETLKAIGSKPKWLKDCHALNNHYPVSCELLVDTLRHMGIRFQSCFD